MRLRHAKYAPFPSSMLILAERKDEFAARIDALKANTQVSQVLDLEHLRTLIDDFPSTRPGAPGKMHGNEHPKAAASMIAVASALRNRWPISNSTAVRREAQVNADCQSCTAYE